MRIGSNIGRISGIITPCRPMVSAMVEVQMPSSCCSSAGDGREKL